MGEGYLIDSNTIIDFCNGKLPKKGRLFLFGISPEISIITNIELFSTRNIPMEEYNLLEKFVSISTIHNLDQNLVEKTIEIRQRNKIKLPDAVIAATAITYGLTLISRNNKDFESIKGLKFINPYEI
jgi:predicted nucleic acid-binding protein